MYALFPMSAPLQQVHAKFKLFSGALESDGSLGALGREMEAFVKANPCAPKSIGVEFLERSKKVIVSLGYAEGEANYGVRFRSVKVGTASNLDAPSLVALEKAMGTEATKLENVICHELLVDDHDNVVMVFMTLAR